jgi:hypothetical protein
MITLTNDFHNSSVSIRATVGDLLTPAQIRKAKATLCGINGCACGGPLGERGEQSSRIEQIGQDKFRVVA